MAARWIQLAHLECEETAVRAKNDRVLTVCDTVGHRVHVPFQRVVRCAQPLSISEP